jgi:hypothetical protein
VHAERADDRERDRHERGVASPVHQEPVEIRTSERRQLARPPQERVGGRLALDPRAAERRRPQADERDRDGTPERRGHAASVGVPSEPTLVDGRPPRGPGEHDRTDPEEAGMGQGPPAEQEGRGDRPAACPAGQGSGCGEERRDEDQVRDEAGAEERGPGPAEHSGGEPAPAWQRPAPPTRERRGREPDRWTERVLEAGEPGHQAVIEHAPDRADQRGRAGPFARERRPTPLRHARPPQVHGHVGSHGKGVLVPQRRPREHAQERGAEHREQRQVDRGAHAAVVHPPPIGDGGHSGGDRTTPTVCSCRSARRCYHRRHARPRPGA